MNYKVSVNKIYGSTIIDNCHGYKNLIDRKQPQYNSKNFQ